MEIIIGHFYFVSDDFFKKVNDPYLKINYERTQRPHYFPFRDSNTGLLWLVPCSSKVEKFERIIAKKKEKNKPVDAIKIVTLFDNKTVLLFQDMFPILGKYILNEYKQGGHPVKIADQNTVKMLEKNAEKIIKIIKKGVKFTPTQPDALRIEQLMIEELEMQCEINIDNNIDEDWELE